MRVKDDTASQLLAIVPSADARWEQPFAYTPRVAYSPVGAMFAHAQVNSMAVRDGSITISAFRAIDGDTIFVRTLPYAGVSIPRRVVDSIGGARRSRDPDGRPLPPQPLDAKRVPPVYVPLRELLLGSDGRTWAVIRESANSFKAIAISQQGEVKAWFKLPPNARIMAATAAHIWLREEDADGVQSIVRYRFGT